MAGARADLTEAGAVPMAREEAEELRMSGRAAARWQIACFLPREEGERDLGTGRAEMEERLMARMAQPVPRLTATGGGLLNLREEQGVTGYDFLNSQPCCDGTAGTLGKGGNGGPRGGWDGGGGGGGYYGGGGGGTHIGSSLSGGGGGGGSSWTDPARTSNTTITPGFQSGNGEIIINYGVANWTIGTDKSDNGKFKIARSTALGANDILAIEESQIELIPDGSEPVVLKIKDDGGLPVSGYIDIDSTGGPPPPADCSASEHVGRMILDFIHSRLYICNTPVARGWDYIPLTDY